jgi:hypothetical protein
MTRRSMEEPTHGETIDRSNSFGVGVVVNLSQEVHFYLLWFVLKLLFITNAALEREFSQVKHVIEAIGESGIQATLKVRLMERTLTSHGALTSPTLASYRTIIC